MNFSSSERKVAASGALVGVALLAGLGTLLVSTDVSALALYSVLVLVTSLWLVQKSIRLTDLKCLTIPGVWYLSYLATMYLPGFSVYFQGIRPYRDRFMFAMQSVLITVPLGFLLVNLAVKFKKEEIRAYFTKPYRELERQTGWESVYVFILCAALGLTILHLMQLDRIALVEMIRNPGAWTYVHDVRLEDLAGMNTRFAMLYSMLRTMFYPILMASSLGFYVCSRKGSWLIILLLSSVLGLGYAALDASKGPVSIVLLIPALFFYLHRVGNLRRSYLLILGAIVLAFPVFVLVQASGKSWYELGDVLQGLSWRIFDSNPSVAYTYFEIFPDEMGFLHGRSIEKLALLMGQPYVDTGLLVFRHFFEHYAKGNSAGGAFFPRFYADFGMPGVLVGGVITGVLLQGIQVFVLRQQKTVLWLAVYAFLISDITAINGESLPSVLLGRGTVLALGIPWALAGLAWIMGGGKRNRIHVARYAPPPIGTAIPLSPISSSPRPLKPPGTARSQSDSSA